MRPVEGRGRADQYRAHVLVAEVQLELLEGPLHEEAGEGVHHRPQTGERQTRARPDQELLADADVDDTVRMAAPSVLETGQTDLGEDDGDARILVEQP